MSSGEVTKWSERGGPAPRRTRLSHPVVHGAHIKKLGHHGSGPKVTLKGHGQMGTTRVGRSK